MTKNYYFTFIALFLSIFSSAQVGINTDDPQGILHIKNTTTDLGVVMPIVNSAEITKTPQGSVPVEATVVYDSIRQCLRLNTQSGWSDCLLDKSAVENIVNISVNGDRYWMPSAYSPLTDKLMQKKFSYGSYATIFASISDLDYVTGAGYSTYGLGISPAEIINPARRVSAHNALTVGGSYGSHIFITTTGEIYVSGLNTSGKLGTGDLASQDGWTLVTIPGLDPEEKPVQLQTNLYSTIILTDKGNVYGAGANYFVGLGLNGSTSTFTKVPGLSNITSIWGERENDNYGAYTAIDADGKVFAWGYNSASGPWGAGASYIPTVEEITSFFSIATLGGARIKKAVVGQASTFALLDDGTFWAATGQGQALWRIGLGSAASPTSNLINITSFLNLDLGEKIVDFDTDLDGTAVITDHYVRISGVDYGYKFSYTDGGTSYTWLKVTDPLYDGKITLTSIDLGTYGMMIGTGLSLIEGGNRIISSGYNQYGNLSASNYGIFLTSPQFSTY